MIAASQLASNLLVQLNVRTGRTFALPILIFFPTARCNSRCLSCDCWQADGAADLTLPEIDRLAAELPALGTRQVVLSGGEPLLRREILEIADLFRRRGIALHLLTSGLMLEKLAEPIAARFAAVTISLDGHTPELYRAIRGVDGLGLVERGVQRLRALAPRLPVRARSTIHRHNFRVLPELIAKARAMGLDQISFLAADVDSDSFGRAGLAAASDVRRLLLDADQADELRRVVERTLRERAADFASGFVAEPPEKLRRLPQYYAAHLGRGPFPEVLCNAPWASAVVEADGSVRPCFFHPRVGTIRERSLREILRSEMVVFRRTLDVATNATCRRCVCSLRVGLRTRVA